MLSRISDPNAAGITGWIAEPEGNGVAVTFYADGDAGPVIVYRVTILGGRIVSRDVHVAAAGRPPLNPIQARMAAARAATGRTENRPCAGEDFNVFVVPPASADGPIDVYQISPQTRRGYYFLGGHFKTSIAADGSVAATRGFTNACLDTAVAEPAAGARPAPIAVTHLLDPLPQEIHVFLSIWTGHPLVVVAGDPQRLFAVTPTGSRKCRARDRGTCTGADARASLQPARHQQRQRLRPIGLFQPRLAAEAFGQRLGGIAGGDDIGDSGGLEPVGDREAHLAVEVHVEHGAVDPVRGDRAIGLLERRRRPDHGRAARAQRLGEVGGEIGLVLDDQDADAVKIFGAEAEQHEAPIRPPPPRPQ